MARWSELNSASLAAVADMYRGWELECTQLSSGHTSSFCRMLEVGGLRVRLCKETIGSLNEVITPRSSTLLSFPLGNRTAMLWHNNEIRPNSALLASSNYEGAVVLYDDYMVLEIELCHHQLKHLNSLQERWENTSKSDKRRVLSMTPGLVRLRNFLSEVMGSEAILNWLASSDNASAVFLTSVLETLGKELDFTIDDQTPKARNDPLDRDYAIFAAGSRFMNRKLGDVVGTRELAETTGASEREVRRAFKRFSGQTPQRYSLTKRLNAAHRILIYSSNGEATVSAVATELGFGELGRFSQYYREVFQEKPSDTLNTDFRSVAMMRSSSNDAS